MKTFPVYILEAPEGLSIFVPKIRRDIGHTEFWETTVAPIVSVRYGISLKAIKNIPYCLKRARIVPKKNVAYFGDEADVRILEALRRETGLPELRFVYDDHERRLPYDVQVFESLLAKVHDDVSGT